MGWKGRRHILRGGGGVEATLVLSGMLSFRSPAGVQTPHLLKQAEAEWTHHRQTGLKKQRKESPTRSERILSLPVSTGKRESSQQSAHTRERKSNLSVLKTAKPQRHKKGTNTCRTTWTKISEVCLYWSTITLNTNWWIFSVERDEKQKPTKMPWNVAYKKLSLPGKTHTDKKEGVGKDHRANKNQKGIGVIIIVWLE